MNYSLLADLLVALHAAYVAFVVLGQVLILVGLARRWGWVRNFWFRIIHLLAIVYVGLEALLGIECPLTIWERQLRELSGQDVSSASFMGRFFNNLLYLDVSSWVFPVMHVSFALVVLATFLLAPPRRPRAAFS